MANNPVPRAPSLRSVLAARMTSLCLRPISSVVPLNKGGVWFTRTLVAVSMGMLGPPLRGTRVTPVHTDDVVGEWIAAPGVEHHGRAIFYLHGSAS